MNVAIAEALRIEEDTKAKSIDNETRSKLNNMMISELESRKNLNDTQALVNGLIATYKQVENNWQKAQYWINVLFKTSFMVSNIGGTVKDFFDLFKGKAAGLKLPAESGLPQESLPSYLDEIYNITSTLDGL